RYPVADHRAQARWNISDRSAEFSCHKQSIARLCRWMMRSRIGKRLISAHKLRIAFIAAGAEKNSAFTCERLRAVPRSDFNAGDASFFKNQLNPGELRQDICPFSQTLPPPPRPHPLPRRIDGLRLFEVFCSPRVAIAKPAPFNCV